MKKLILSLFIAFGLSGCSLNNDDLVSDCGTDTNVAFTGFPLLCNYSVKTLPNNSTAYVLESQERMDTYFTKHENTCTVPSDPNIDFSKNLLVGIFAGIKPTNGYLIKITSIIENNCQIKINFYEKAPAAGETVTQNPTYPSDFILIPRTNKPIIFNKVNESADNIVIGAFGGVNFYSQLNDFNILNFQNVATGNYDFGQYKYTVKTKRGEYTSFLKSVPAEILALKGQTKVYGTPDVADGGGTYFELRQGAVVTKVSIDNIDTDDQSTEIKIFKKAIQDKITSLK